MKILVYGAGVIGSIYAAKLFDAKNDVTLLARGDRFESLQQNGVTIKEQLTGKKVTAHLPLTQQLAIHDFYDLIIVTVRLDQLESVMPDLKNNSGSSLVMFMLNYPDNIQSIADQLKPKHIIFGFPGVGGIFKENAIDFIQIKQQKTTIGETNGKKPETIKKLKSLFETAGFNVDVNENIQAWLKTHAVFMACVSAAIIKENGDNARLGKNKNTVKLMVQSIKEGFKALKTLGISITPFKLKIIFMMMPLWFSVSYWQKAMQGTAGTLAMAPHVNAAKAEMKLIAKKVLKIVHPSPVATNNLKKLLSEFINFE
ncbi:MAG TPA: 2-dehydropantoate 2-reductase N-terminal domain-containing protein [Hanamia sp.]|nr:2-dehydropantoate 2-reductase N-terminal domain-containing protein [Hanamia sp.]